MIPISERFGAKIWGAPNADPTTTDPTPSFSALWLTQLFPSHAFAWVTPAIFVIFGGLRSEALVSVIDSGRMQIRRFRRFRRNKAFLTGNKNTVYQKQGFCHPRIKFEKTPSDNQFYQFNSEKHFSFFGNVTRNLTVTNFPPELFIRVRQCSLPDCISLPH